MEEGEHREGIQDMQESVYSTWHFSGGKETVLIDGSYLYRATVHPPPIDEISSKGELLTRIAHKHVAKYQLVVENSS